MFLLAIVGFGVSLFKLLRGGRRPQKYGFALPALSYRKIIAVHIAGGVKQPVLRGIAINTATSQIVGGGTHGQKIER